jgi:tetratricopeptide (TPR) repeat protein
MAPDSEWQKLQNACAEIVAKNPNPQERADARMIAIQGLCWQGKNEQALAVCEQYLREFAGPAKLATFPVHVAWAHLIAGICLERLGRHSEALARYEWIVQPRPGQPENWAGDEILPAAYFRIWHAR